MPVLDTTPFSLSVMDIQLEKTQKKYSTLFRPIALSVDWLAPTDPSCNSFY